MVTLTDVAREAQVAPSTVSLVVNNGSWVSEETRARVTEAIRRLGYKPRRKPAAEPPDAPPPAKGFRAGVIYTRSAIHHGEELSVITRAVIGGLRDAVAQKGAQLNIFAGKERASQDTVLQHLLESRELDGAVLLGPDPRDGYLRLLLRSGLPTVVLNRRPFRGEYSGVSVDYRGGGRRGIRHLLKQGHRRIALLAGSRKFWPSREMRAGALEALESHGLEPVFDWHRKWDVKSYPDICRQVIDGGATAYFTGGYPALWAANYFAGIGVRVPDDISLLGLDDLGLKTDAGLKITSVGYDMHQQGRIAAETLLRLVQEKPLVKHINISLRTRLVEGETVARLSPIAREAQRLDEPSGTTGTREPPHGEAS